MRLIRIAPASVAAALVLAACAQLSDPSSPSSPSTGGVTTTMTVPPPRPSQAPTQTVTLATLPPGADVCDAFSHIEVTGALRDPDLNEISGLAASRRNPRIIWAHNDSRGRANIYALTIDGALVATYQLEGVIALDWEDAAAGPGPDANLSYLYVGDIGDNFALRSEIVVYRFPEPEIGTDGVVTEFETFRLSYPEPGPNAEALAVDPVTGDLLIVTKDRAGPEVVWRAPGNELRDGLATRLEPLASLRLGNGVEITAADFTANGDRIAFRGYDEVWIWPRLEHDLSSTFAAEPCMAASPDEVQGEALAFDAAAVNLYTISEGVGAAINQLAVER